MPGPKKAPRYLKLLKGTLRPCRDEPVETSALPAMEAVPSPPAWLKNLEALKEWHRLASVMTANSLLHAGNQNAFAHYCAVHASLIQTWAARETPTAAMLAAFRTLAGSLGLLNIATPKPIAGNKFAKNATLRQ